MRYDESEMWFAVPEDSILLCWKFPCDHKHFPFHIIFQVSVIHEPNVFYKTVVEKCRTAKQRITLASLYLGTGHLEEQLVKAKEIKYSSSIITHLCLLTGYDND